MRPPPLPGTPVVELPSILTPATKIRGSVVYLSQQSLRARSLYDRYLEALAPPYRDGLAVPAAEAWLPMELGLAHYEACQRLGLGYQERYEIGREVEQRVQRGVVQVIATVARTGGATPWLIFKQAPRLWSRMFVGSAVAASEVAPKEAVFQVAAWPLAGNEYLHAGLSGVLAGFIRPLCKTSSARLIQASSPEQWATWRVVWT